MHVWNSANRGQGIAKACLEQSISMFFKILNLEMIICEPYAKNKAPNKTLQSLGFRSVKRYLTTPGPINLKQEVNRYEIYQHE
jgi:RimJ/RimL family protein N-acetyltransferase